MSNIKQKRIYTPDANNMTPMRRVNGPVKGPTRPATVPIEIVRECLLQANPPRIMEVIQWEGKETEPVLLTIDNYTIPYTDLLEIQKPAEWVKLMKKMGRSIDKEETPAEPVKVEQEISQPVDTQVVEPVVEDETPINPVVDEDQQPELEVTPKPVVEDETPAEPEIAPVLTEDQPEVETTEDSDEDQAAEVTEETPTEKEEKSSSNNSKKNRKNRR